MINCLQEQTITREDKTLQKNGMTFLKLQIIIIRSLSSFFKSNISFSSQCEDYYMQLLYTNFLIFCEIQSYFELLCIKLDLNINYYRNFLNV